MSLFLIGFRHSNQSVVGKILSEKIHWRFIDFDSYVKNNYLKSDGSDKSLKECSECSKQWLKKCQTEALDELFSKTKQIIRLDDEELLQDEETVERLKKNTILYKNVKRSSGFSSLGLKNQGTSFNDYYLEKHSYFKNMALFHCDASDKTPEEMATAIGNALKGTNIIENWYAVRTKSRHEQKVREQLQNKSFKVFLPMIEAWSKRKDRKKKIMKPLFPGYLFVDFELSKESWLEVVKVPGVANILGYTKEPYPVPEEQIESLKAIIDSNLKVSCYSYLKKGDKVHVVSGPLEGAIGVLEEMHEKKQRLVVSIDMLNRSVAVEIEGDLVEKYY
jgi:transcriptional antiterminator NusG